MTIRGKTGSGLVERPGFATLLSAVCHGEVGAVVALEASRLARNNRDWHHLIDLCALTETLIIDADGAYDPRLLNDRLLLGLKGTMSEFELGLFRQRAREAFEMKVAQGHVMWEVPVGLVRDDDDHIEKIADRQVHSRDRRRVSQVSRTGFGATDDLMVSRPEGPASRSGFRGSWTGSRVATAPRDAHSAGSQQSELCRRVGLRAHRIEDDRRPGACPSRAPRARESRGKSGRH